MEDLRSSRRAAAKSAYRDVFGAPSKFSAGKSSDYAEIFGGGFASSCSIPFLDLPPASEAADGVGFINYSEIFGGIKYEGFAVDYEELLGVRKKAVTSSRSSSTPSDERSSVEAKFGQQAEEVSSLSQEDVTKDNRACPLKKKFASSSNHFDDGSKQFSMSYDRTTDGSREAPISGKTLNNHLHSVPGYTGVISSCPSEDVRGDDSLHTQPDIFIHNLSNNARVNDVQQGKMAPPSSSADNIKSYGAELGTEEKDFGTKFTASIDGPLNVKHHSRSSSNYSTSSGDISCPNVTYVSVSDINLRTQPSKIPPPSKAPPKLFSNQENTKMKMSTYSRAEHDIGNLLKHTLDHQIQYKVGAPKSHGRQGVAKDTSSCFFDVEEDASSAAAAMKVAMEQAQARLKSAKELMERKRDNLQSFKKLGEREGAAFDEKEFKSSEEENLFQDEASKKSLLKEDKRMKESALDDTKKAIKVGTVVLNHEEREIYVTPTEASREIRQENGVKSSKMPSKSEEVSGEWKTDNQYYELVNNGAKYRVVKEAFKSKVVENKPKQTTEVNEDMRNYSEQEPLSCECPAGKLEGVNESSERDDDDSKADKMAWKEEINKTPTTILDTCTTKENAIKLDEERSSCHQKGTETRQADQEAFVCEQELNKPYAGEEASISGKSEKNVESSNGAPKIHIEYSKSQAAVDAHEHDELCGTNLTSFSFEGENKLKILQEKDMHENKKNVRSRTHMGGTMEVVQIEEAYFHENSETTGQCGSHQPCHEENEWSLEGIVSASEQEVSKKLYGFQGVCMQAENDLESGAAQDGHEVKPNSEGLKPAVGIIQPSETENEMTSKREACGPDSIEIDTIETQVDNLHNENQDADQTPSEQNNSADKKHQDADQMPLEQEIEVNPRVLKSDYQENEKRKLKEANENFDEEERLNLFYAREEVCQRTENKDPRDVDHAKLSAKKEKLETNERADQEREDEKEKARKAQEDKEREREREKDRLAVERATCEAHERALAAARERAERMTADARQRAVADSREKADKAAAEALEKSLIEKALKDAKLRAERAAAERAIAEARERAVGKALAEKAAADVRQRAERLNSVSRDKGRKENESGDYFKVSDKEDREIKLKRGSSDVPHDARFSNAGPSSNSQRKVDSYPHGDSESPLRCKARLERHQRTVERAAKALAEKNMRDILAQREQTERNRLAESLDADVRRWSTGKEGNLRALLSTLQYILGPESGWQPIPLTDVITAAAVKRAYRKATLCVHPDKLQQRGANIQQKYICEKVFDLLKDAWSRFNSEER